MAEQPIITTSQGDLSTQFPGYLTPETRPNFHGYIVLPEKLLDFLRIARDELGLNVKSGIPASIRKLMSLYPQPVRQLPSIEFLPIAPGRGR